jgi:uncharacterized protein (TIGR00251 family)
MDPERVKIYVKPNSPKNSVEGFYNGRIKIKVCSPPQEGKANKELIDFISKKIGVSKKNIRIVSGEKSNLKEIEIIKKPYTDIYAILLEKQ